MVLQSECVMDKISIELKFIKQELHCLKCKRTYPHTVTNLSKITEFSLLSTNLHIL